MYGFRKYIIQGFKIIIATLNILSLIIQAGLEVFSISKFKLEGVLGKQDYISIQ